MRGDTSSSYRFQIARGLRVITLVIVPMKRILFVLIARGALQSLELCQDLVLPKGCLLAGGRPSSGLGRCGFTELLNIRKSATGPHPRRRPSSSSCWAMGRPSSWRPGWSLAHCLRRQSCRARSWDAWLQPLPSC